MKPVGVFDSGVGGLSVLRSLLQTLPGVPFVYVADQAHAPYGEKTQAHIEQRARCIAQGLRDQFDIGALVVACNTAPAHAIDAIRPQHSDLPIVGVEPALTPAAVISASGCIGVLATRGTLHSERYARLRQQVAAQSARPLHFVDQACDGLADAIEQDDAEAIGRLVQRYVQSMWQANSSGNPIDTLVLGCTHYPFAAEAIAAQCPPGVRLIDTGEPVARRTRQVLGLDAHAASSTAARVAPILLSTAAPAALQRAAQRWVPECQEARHWPC